MRILADTNLVVRLAQPGHQHHSIARRALERLRTADHEICIVPQVLYEFWVVSTRPSVENGLGMTVPEALAEVAEIKALFRLFRDERAVLDQWERLIVAHEIQGKSAHDTRLVAAMHRHGLSHILTFNVKDFSRYSSITPLNPDIVIQTNLAGELT